MRAHATVAVMVAVMMAVMVAVMGAFRVQIALRVSKKNDFFQA